ncbi:hypothetical protein [Chryseobacterium indologenes]|uniref:hypothetical protein n=1 Tax=Chryseobacterium indologenes TaxID=253 RepID=UPI001F4A92BF|nr:hypothetical protein [Chryseobacterium indologenes]
MNVYDLSRKFWDFAFENPDKIKPNHGAMYFFAIEHCNRLGWKERFGFPTVMAMEAIGIKSYNTFINTLKELVEFGFIEMIEKSKNQYSSNIIALSNFNEAHDKALDKALIKHVTKQSESTVQSTSESIDSINKQIYNITNTPIYNILLEKESKEDFLSIEESEELFPKSDPVNPESEEKEKSSAKKEKEKFFNRADFKKKLLELGVLEKHADDWIQARKNKRASFTESVIDGIIRECEKHNYPFPDAIRHCAEKSWQGFKFNWLEKEENGKTNNNSTTSGFTSSPGNSGGSPKVSGKISGRALLARELNEKSSRNSQGGNFTIDAEIIE